MASNQERRSAAVNLRELADGDYLPVQINAALKEAINAPSGYWRTLCKRLADLIDRPLCDPLFYCEDEERPWEDAEPSDEEGADFCQCGNCGERLHWIWGEKLPHYCHNCGAEVER